MPTVINGIGTWYYGKRRIHRLKGTCGFCHRVGELQSYDTTLYFVVLFVPVIPLTKKRVLEACPYCQRHRVLSLKKWQALKADAVSKLMEKLEKDPDDRDAIREALAVALSFQDGALFEKLASSLAQHRLDDPDIQSQLGAGYAYFARWQEAEAAYRAALAVADHVECRRQLALALLKQGRPEDAAPFLAHILENRVTEQAGMIYLLIQGYQAQGMHEEALDLIDRRDAAFPELATHKEIKKQRKISERYLRSGKRIRSGLLSESSKTGYREGNWRASLPAIISTLVILGFLSWYLGTALWMGQAHRIYVVNGGAKIYTVAIANKELKAPPGIVRTVRVPEGEVTVEFRDATIPLEPVRCRIETPFFTRPFSSPTFVINPDRLAVLVKEEVQYSEAPVARQPKAEYLVGNLLYALDNIDYEFTPFPPTASVKQGQTLTKTRIDVMTSLLSEARLGVVTRQLSPKDQIAYAKRWLGLKPDDLTFLGWLLGKLPGEEALAFLNSHLHDRPVLVDWHRAYQDLRRKLHPNEDLLPVYRKLVTETKEVPTALYLLARIQDQDLDEADKLLRRAAAATPPCVYAMNGLGYLALEQGRFNDALSWTDKAIKLAPFNPIVQHGYRQALLASHQYDRLLDELRNQAHLPGQRLSALVEQIRVSAAKGDQAKARAILEETTRLLLGPQSGQDRLKVQAHLELLISYGARDVAGFLKLAPQLPDLPAFPLALLRGHLAEAAGLIRDKDDDAGIQHALLYLAALKAGDQKLAAQQEQSLVTALGKGRPPWRQMGRILSGAQVLDSTQVRRLPIEPEQKRVLVAVLARRYPDSAKELLPLALKLDFAADLTSLCLRKVLA